MDQDQRGNDNTIHRQTSMATLIMWNISKALKSNPRLDLKTAIKETQMRLHSNKGIINFSSLNPEEEHLSCAILAWQKLGHSGTDSLYQFIQTKQKESHKADEKAKEESKAFSNKKAKLLNPGSYISYDAVLGSATSHSAGPVVKLPTETTKIVMRVDNQQCRHSKKSSSKVEAACCKESACVERLAALDKETNELRTRAQRLARREAQRAEMLERAEAAWKDLEAGFQRRLRAAEEKEEFMMKHIQKVLEERNGYKSVCTGLVQKLREKGELAEQERKALTEVEKDMCCKACERLRLNEQMAHIDAKLAEIQCKSAQLDRDLQFKEEQINCQLRSMGNDMDCSRVLTHEMERTMHSELCGLRDQIRKMSEQLLEEDSENGKIKEELELLRQEKMEIVEDLENCQVMCSGRVQDKVDELKKKREQLEEVKEVMTECLCKVPVDAIVEAKRTPSLAALCKCRPDDSMESCSCSSLRTTLLTSLLSDLFGGLQSELGDIGPQMPCQMLKCLEDNHNWDRSSVLKTNLRNYFSKLLVGELEIAIATSIEKYHARWIGASCADAVFTTTCRSSDPEGGQQRAIEKRAHKMAEELAEQLFHERAEQLTAKAKDVLKSGPPPCACSKASAAVYPCFVELPMIGCGKQGNDSPDYGQSCLIVTSIEDPNRSQSNGGQLCVEELSVEKPIETISNLETLPTENFNMGKPSAEKPIVGKLSSDKLSHSKIMDVHPSGSGMTTPAYWRRTHQDVNQLKAQLEDLKKDSIKKEDLKLMEENLVKLVQRSVQDTLSVDVESGKETEKKSNTKNILHKKMVNNYNTNKSPQNNKLSCIKKKPLDLAPKMGNKNFILGLQMDKTKKSDQTFAVNLCLCKSEKQTKKVPLLKQDTRDLRDVEITKRSTRNSIKQTKPLITNFITDSISCVKKKNKPLIYCPSEVACFHKPPSCTSLNKLLEKLAKWRSDMFNNVKSKPETVSTDKDCNIDDILEPLNNSSKEIIENLSATKSNGLSKDKISHVLKSEVSRGMPVTTESEYMGAVNLDKSNDIFDKNAENETKNDVSNFYLSQKCSDGCKCPYNDIEKDISRRENINIKNKSKDLPTAVIDQSHTTNTPITHGLDIDNENDQNVKTETPCRNNYEYCIKFLGVTLTNANSKRKDNSECISSHNISTDIKYKSLFNSYVNKKSNPIDSTKNTFLNGNILKPELASCDCSIRYDEFKSLINDVFGKQHGDYCKNEDKSLDTRSLKTDPESCICCKVSAKNDNPDDLEVNAFQLLENHLKDKLNDFKVTTCKSSCLTSIKEQKVFASILERVKKIILENTGNMTCNCANDNDKELNWQRAYMLLQEYLKIKINRVQCLCHSGEEKENAVPKIIEKVYNLIDDDFQRLKNMCECKSVTKKVEKELNFADPIEIPEKDSAHIYDQKTINSPLLHANNKLETDSNNFEPANNISSQFAPLMENNTTSCYILKRDNENEASNFCVNSCVCVESDSLNKLLLKANQTVSDSNTNFTKESDLADTKPDNVKHQNQKPYFFVHKDCILLGNLKEITKDHSQINNNETVKNKTDTHNIAPYVGYTIDCSCHEVLGTCNCTKSYVTANLHNINNIWNTVTTNKSKHTDISYIMNAQTPANHAEHNENIYSMNDFDLYRNKIMCDTKVSVHGDEDIVLKDSEEYLNRLYVSKTTSNRRYIFENDQPVDWCGCSHIQNNTHDVADFSENTNCENSLYYPIGNLRSLKFSEIDIKTDTINLPSSISSNCDCSMVPMCHVKMLVENIEKRLINSKCTCDSLCSVVCPVHSKKVYDEI